MSLNSYCREYGIYLTIMQLNAYCRESGQPTEQESFGGPHGGRYGDVSAFSEHPPNNANYDPHNESQVSDSFYRDSPLGERYNVQKGVPDGYGAPPENRYTDQSYVGDQPGYDGYRDDNRYGRPQDDHYLPPDERLANLSLEDSRNLHDGPGPEGYRGHEPLNDSYGDHQPQEQTFGDYDDSPYRPDVKHHGLPKVQQDPFADDPFQSKENLVHRDQYNGPLGDDRYRDDREDPQHYNGPLHGDDGYRGDPRQYNGPLHDDDRYRDDREDPQQYNGPLHDDDRYRDDRGDPNQVDDSYLVRDPEAEDPYKRGPPMEEDSYLGKDPIIDAPYMDRGPPQDEDSFLGRNAPGDDRYRDEDPYSGRPQQEDNPYGSRHLQDEDPYSGRPVERRPSQSSERYGKFDQLS